MIEWWLYPLAGSVVGLLVGLTGVGGGALMTPILLFGFGVDLPVAIATDLLFAAVTKTVASFSHARGEHIDWQIAIRMWCGSLSASILIVLAVALGLIKGYSGVLIPLVGVVILISGITLLGGKHLQLFGRHARTKHPISFKRWQMGATVLTGGFLGAIVALTSIGAGALGAVLLRILYPLRLTPIRLVATDTVHAIPVALSAGMGMAIFGYTDYQLLIGLLIGSLPAALFGSLWAARFPAEALRKTLGIVLIAVALKMILW